MIIIMNKIRMYSLNFMTVEKEKNNNTKTFGGDHN